MPSHNTKKLKQNILLPSEKQLGSYKKFLSVPDLSIILGLSRQAIYSLIKKGQIKGKHVGRRFFIPKSFLDNLEDFEEEQKL